MTSGPKIGDTVYQFDVNRRVYKKDAAGHSTGGPIYREHFRPYVIVGEDKRSWILDTPERSWAGEPFPGKVAKAKVLTADEMDADCWRHDHRYQLSQAISRCNDVAILKQIAALVGYGQPPTIPSAEIDAINRETLKTHRQRQLAKS